MAQVLYIRIFFLHKPKLKKAVNTVILQINKKGGNICGFL